MAANGHSNGDDVEEIEVSPVIFQNLSNLEKEFAVVEIDALRKKEHNLKPLYTKRSALLKEIPSFWPQVLLNGPQDFQEILSHDIDEDDDTDVGNIDITTIGCITNLHIERYQITSETEGEPRSLRFTFEFDKSRNPVFEDERVVKEFEYVTTSDGEGGGFISKPVTFKWTKKGKKLMTQKTGGVLDLAVELYQAEEATRVKVKGGSEVNMVERETLWQYEKLREKMESIEDKVMEGNEDGVEACWLDWFGYRGPVDILSTGSKSDKKEKEKKAAAEKKDGGAEEDDLEGLDEDEDDDEGLLDVEIFPAGENIAIALAEELWPNVMDYFMNAQDPLSDDEDDDDADDDDEIPDLVNIEDIEADLDDDDDAVEKSDPRPTKKQRTK